MTNAREVIVLQLRLLSLIRTEESLVPIGATARAELVDLMARILVAVFQIEGRRLHDGASVQSQDQAGAPCAQSHCLPASIQRETGAAEQGEPAPSI
jgi:hypothetical protein